MAGMIVTIDPGPGGYIDLTKYVHISNGQTYNVSTSVPNTTRFVVENTASLCVCSGGETNSAIISSGGKAYVSNGGIMNNPGVSAGGWLVVSSGGTLNSALFRADAYIDLMSGATVNSARISGGGLMTVAYGVVVNSANVLSNGRVRVCYGGAINDVVNSLGYIEVSAGATIDALENSGGRIDVYSGAVLTNVRNVVGGGSLGTLYIHSGGTVVDAVTNFGSTFVSAGGKVDYAKVYVSGILTIGGDANSATVCSGGTMVIVDGGKGYFPTVSSGGRVIVSKGGVVSNATVSAGIITVSSGGKVTGRTFLSGTITAQAGAIIEFDVSSITPDASVRVTNLDKVAGSPTYTLVVSDWQENGTYKLAFGTTFNQTITVQNTSGQKLGTLAMDETITVGKRKYSLGIFANILTLTVDGEMPVPDTVAPTVRNVRANITAPTNQNVTVTAEFADDVEVASKLYRIGNGSWTNYVSGVTVQNNSTIYFKAVDSSGNESGVVSFKVDNIDRTAPTVSVITPASANPAQSVTVKANFNDNASVASRLYRIGASGEWRNYSNGVTVTDNVTVYFKAVDTAGNESDIASYAVTNIETAVPDTVKPTVTNVKANTTAPTNQDVKVTAEFADDVEVASMLYRIGSKGSWTNYVSGVTVQENSTVYFKAVDTAGNESGLVSYSVTNIDKEDPTITGITPNTTKPTDSVTIRASFADDVELASKLYRIGSGEWLNYINGVTVTDNVTVYFRAVDAAGNEAEERYVVTNIQQTDPEWITADNGWNDYLYSKKENPSINRAVYDSDSQIMDAGTTQIRFDDEDLKQYDDMPDFVGRDKAGTLDAADFAKIELESAASLCFELNGTDAIKFTVWELIEGKDKKGKTTYRMKSLQSTSLRKQKDAEFAATTKPLLLEAGTYWISMESAAGKKAGEGFYSVQLDGDSSEFYTQCDNSDDWTDMKELGDAGAVGSVGVIDGSDSDILTDWVGFGDVKDYKMFTLESAADLSFSLSARAAAKFTIWELVEKTDRKGNVTYSLKLKQKATVLKKSRNGDYLAETRALLLEAGTYYFSMEATNAKNGGSTDYTVSLNDCSFYVQGDNSDDWNDMKVLGDAGAVGSVGVISGTDDNLLTDWVGYGDAIDYMEFTLNTDAKLNFVVSADNAVKFTVWRLVEKTDKKGNVTYSLKSLQTANLKAGDGAKTLNALSLSKGSYFFSVEFSNAKKGGGAEYNVSVIHFSAQPNSGMNMASAMPEAAGGGLNTSDVLSFDRLDADVLADASAAVLADLDGKSEWQNIASLA